ncbi:hypothetical protein CHO01_12990 [Cellulomonas hominis]|uniref:PH domain-containing protein n=2 Tax=Cellulomonas hominis TaxID=156981 RepID=A0A511FAD2_9CELL|nr:hypothetical protein [Cellulomonas hominis]GEL46183.1 hypothetical protein CHO01_12990 [Cellulomonas hominis]
MINRPSHHSGAESSAPDADTDPWLRAARRRELPVMIGICAFGALLVVLGRTAVPLIVLGLWIVGVGAILRAGRAVRDRQERGEGPRGSIGLGRLGDESATVLREHPAHGLLTAGMTAWPGALFLAAAGLGAGGAMSSGLAVVVGLVGLGFVVAGARQAVRVRRAGVWLTPTRLTVRERDQSYRVGWADLAAVSVPSRPTDLVVVLASGSAAVTVSGRERRRFPRGPRGEIPIRTEASAVDAAGVARVLRHFGDGGETTTLGQAGSDELVARLART